jgi:hypothetical protein
MKGCRTLVSLSAGPREKEKKKRRENVCFSKTLFRKEKRHRNKENVFEKNYMNI